MLANLCCCKNWKCDLVVSTYIILQPMNNPQTPHNPICVAIECYHCRTQNKTADFSAHGSSSAHSCAKISHFCTTLHNVMCICTLYHALSLSNATCASMPAGFVTLSQGAASSPLVPATTSALHASFRCVANYHIQGVLNVKSSVATGIECLQLHLVEM